MVKFNFCLFNHGPSSRESLCDLMMPMKYSLESLGHLCTVSPDRMDPSSVNLLFDYFPTPGLSTRLPTKYGVVATEWFDGRGFNGEDQNRNRFAGFMNMVYSNKCLFVWSFTRSTRDLASEFTKSALVDLGHVPEMVYRKPHLSPDFDFSFCGTPSGHRVPMLGQVTEVGTLVTAPHSTKDVRDSTYRRARWSIGLKPCPVALPVPSASRITSSLFAGRPVLAEPVAEPTPLFIGVNATRLWKGTWRETCLAALRENWSTEYERQMNGLESVPMKPTMEKAVDETMG